MDTTPDPRRTPDVSEATRWRLDPAGSRAEFRVPNFWGLLTVTGRFDRLDGRLDVDASGERRMELTIDAASIATGNRRRDRHLRSADFLAADENPELRFESTAVTDADDGGVRVEGELVAAGHRIALALATRLEPAGDGQLALEVSTVVDQRQLGMTWSPLGMVRSPAAIHIHALLRPER